MDMYRLEPGKTCWVLIADSGEPRHLFDLGLGYVTLRSRGYSTDDIIIFTSHPAGLGFLSLFGAPDCCALRDVALLQVAGAYETCVVVVSGHGHEAGFGTPAIRPAALAHAVRGIRGLKVGVLVFGQCYAGVFNPLDASSRPFLVAVGATSLDTSLSTGFALPLGGSGKELRWAANSFLIGFFNWMLHPVDVDGDGETTLADAYKSAGVYAARQTNGAKSSAFIAAQQLAAKLMFATLTDLERKSTERALKEKVEVIHQVQVPWLLHARLAARLTFR